MSLLRIRMVELIWLNSVFRLENVFLVFVIYMLRFWWILDSFESEC